MKGNVLILLNLATYDVTGPGANWREESLEQAETVGQISKHLHPPLRNLPREEMIQGFKQLPARITRTPELCPDRVFIRQEIAHLYPEQVLVKTGVSHWEQMSRHQLHKEALKLENQAKTLGPLLVLTEHDETDKQKNVLMSALILMT